MKLMPHPVRGHEVVPIMRFNRKTGNATVTGYKCSCKWNPAGPLQVQKDAVEWHIKDMCSQQPGVR